MKWSTLAHSVYKDTKTLEDRTMGRWLKQFSNRTKPKDYDNNDSHLHRDRAGYTP